LKEEDKKWITDAYYNDGKYINEGKVHHLDVDMDFDDEIWDKNDNNLDKINCNVQSRKNKRNIVSHNNGKYSV